MSVISSVFKLYMFLLRFVEALFFLFLVLIKKGAYLSLGLRHWPHVRAVFYVGTGSQYTLVL